MILRMRRWALLLALWSVIVPSARSVIIAGADGSINTGAPGNGAPWDHVGTIGGASGVYLGAYGDGYWVITANHVGVGNFTVNSTTYSAVGGSGRQIGGADLLVFRLATEPPLTGLQLSATAPAAASSITMIGNGMNRDTNLTTWYVDNGTNPDTWSTTSFGAADFSITGYLWGSGNTMRWGTNQITGSTTYNSTSLLYSTFDLVGDAQGATGDSGGGVFFKNGSTWELTGVMDFIGTLDGQPGSTAVFDNTTMFADISVYRSTILAAIPEPAFVGVGAAIVALGVAIVARRRR